MIKYELDIENFLKNFSIKNDITKMTNNKLTFEYYKHKGVGEETSVKDWLIMLAERKCPSYNETKRYFKKIRKKYEI